MTETIYKISILTKILKKTINKLKRQNDGNLISISVPCKHQSVQGTNTTFLGLCKRLRDRDRTRDVEYASQ